MSTENKPPQFVTTRCPICGYVKLLGRQCAMCEQPKPLRAHDLEAPKQ